MHIRHESDQPNGVLLQAPSLYLRDFELADWVNVHHYAMDPEVTRYMPWGPNTAEQSFAFTRNAVESVHVVPRVSYDLAIIDRSNNHLIGGAGLYIDRTRVFAGEIGYCLQKESWGRGFGTEVACLLVHLGFDHLHLHRLSATCDPENVGSARVLEKVGFKREGLMRSHMKTRTGLRDSYLYALLVNYPRLKL